MKLNEVVSSSISKVGYEDNCLLVEYLSGAQYKYKNVPRELYEELLGATSKGKFIAAKVKGKFDYDKLG